MNKDTFSVIVLVYNNQQYIKECIDSILEQDYESVEIIIKDDASEEFNIEEIERYINENKRENLVNYSISPNKENVGTVKNINLGIKECTGEYFMILACDDKLYDKSVISNLVNEFKITGCMAMIGFIEIFNGITNQFMEIYPRPKIMEFINRSEPIDLYKRLCEHNCLPGPGFTCSKKIIDKYGYYNEIYKLQEDYPRYLNLSRLGCRIWFIDKVLVSHRYGVGVYSKGWDEKDNRLGQTYMNDREVCSILEIKPYIDDIK